MLELLQEVHILEAQAGKDVERIIFLGEFSAISIQSQYDLSAQMFL